jgi:hypothetical protein
MESLVDRAQRDLASGVCWCGKRKFANSPFCKWCHQALNGKHRYRSNPRYRSPESFAEGYFQAQEYLADRQRVPMAVTERTEVPGGPSIHSLKVHLEAKGYRLTEGPDGVLFL